MGTGKISTRCGIGAIERAQHLASPAFIKTHRRDAIGHAAILCVCRWRDFYCGVIFFRDTVMYEFELGSLETCVKFIE